MAEQETAQERLHDSVVEMIKTVYDPEIPVNIHELGLIYSIDINEDGEVKILMTLTSPACPSAEEIPPEVRNKVLTVPGVFECDVEIVWEPTWNPEMMSEAAKLELGFM